VILIYASQIAHITTLGLLVELGQEECLLTHPSTWVVLNLLILISASWVAGIIVTYHHAWPLLVNLKSSLFWMVDLYQMCLFQIFSHSLWLTFPFSYLSFTELFTLMKSSLFISSWIILLLYVKSYYHI
jgi:hypothetical protein